MKLLIFHGFYHQILGPDVLSPIQDLPKRPPMGLIKFPEGPLGSCKGAAQKIRRVLGCLLGKSWAQQGSDMTEYARAT